MSIVVYYDLVDRFGEPVWGRVCQRFFR